MQQSTEIPSPAELRKGLVKERRLARMRLGQATCELHSLVSDPEIRVALVPLVEEEYEMALMESAVMEVPDNMVGIEMRDRKQSHVFLSHSIRDPRNLEERVYKSADEVVDDLEVTDINYLMDAYYEMVNITSPSIDGLTIGQMDDLKKALTEMDWNALSGASWFALRRFLMSLPPGPLVDSLLGSMSTKPSTTTSD